MSRKKWLIITVIVALAIAVPIGLLASTFSAGANKTGDKVDVESLGFTVKESAAIPEGQAVWSANYSEFLGYVEALNPAIIYDVPANVDWLAPLSGHGSFSWKIPPDIPQSMREAFYFESEGTIYVYQ